MSRYDGLIIPRSYSEYINKTDAATLSQALQLSGVLSDTVADGDNKAVKSRAVYTALQTLQNKIIIKTDANDCVPGIGTAGAAYFQPYIVNRPASTSDNNNTPSTYRNWLILCAVTYSSGTAFTAMQLALGSAGDLYTRVGSHSSSVTTWNWGEWVQK